ncbi:MAG TPA: DUF4397 domain-containing protein [Polyangiaceae bacterium]|nr:DUF4397 domain-containing protein [Polyangiaceae bacterium]
MKIRNSKWLALGGMSVGVLVASMEACGGDDSSAGGGTDSGSPDVTVIDSATPDAGHDGPEVCGVAPDPDPTPKVRLVNLLLARNVQQPVGQGDPPAVRLYVNGTAVSDLGTVPGGRGPLSVTKYAKVAAGAITFSVQATGADGGVSYTLPTDVLDVPSGARLTIFAVGSPGQTDEGKAKLVIVREDFPAVQCGQVALRFVNADFDWGTGPDSFVVDHAAQAAANLSLGQVSDAAGLVAPVTTKSIVVTNSYPQLEGPTGQAPFTVPASVLARGRSYFVISAGEQFRVADDERNQGLLLLPVGDDTQATWIKRDPIAYLFHAAPPSTPPTLQVQSGGQTLAINLDYGQIPTYTDLPLSGAQLDFVPVVPDAGVDGGGGAVLEHQDTGPLDPGGVYVVGLLGSGAGAGAQPLQMKLWKIQPDFYFGSNLNYPRVVAINAALSAPTADVGYWSVDNGGTKGNTFTPVFAGIAYGAISDSSGVDIKAPQVSGAQWLGAQLAGQPATNRATRGTLSAGWQLAVLLGDWSASSGASSANLVFMGFSSSETSFPLPAP